MLKMKRNVKFEINVKAGTNAEMSDEEFEAQLAAAVGRAELNANAQRIRFHFTMGPTIEDKDKTSIAGKVADETDAEVGKESKALDKEAEDSAKEEDKK